MNIRKIGAFAKNTIALARRVPVPASKRLYIVYDFLSLYRKKALTHDEYYNFEFEKQSEEFRQTFLGINEERYYLTYLNPVKYYSLARNKYLTHKILDNTGVRKADLFCYYQPEGQVIASDEIANNIDDVYRILKKRQVKQCVVKATEGTHGDSVYVVNHIDYGHDDCSMTLFNNETVKLSEIVKDSPLIFESVISQTTQFSAFNSSSVNTIRFITLLYPDGKARIAETTLKSGRKGKCVDNAGSGGNIIACVDLATGEIYNVTEFNGWRDIKAITHHPDSGTLMEGVKIKNWDAIVEQVLHYQECFPYIKAAGWDIALTEDGPVVIEVNDFWDLTLQYVHRQGRRNVVRDCFLAWKATGKKYSTGSLRLPLNDKKLIQKFE